MYRYGLTRGKTYNFPIIDIERSDDEILLYFQLPEEDNNDTTSES
jgi:hypothetical protein